MALPLKACTDKVSLQFCADSVHPMDPKSRSPTGLFCHDPADSATPTCVKMSYAWEPRDEESEPIISDNVASAEKERAPVVPVGILKLTVEKNGGAPQDEDAWVFVEEQRQDALHKSVDAFKVPKSKSLYAFVVVDWRADFDALQSKYLEDKPKQQTDVMTVAKRTQFMEWKRLALLRAVAWREHPTTKCLAYNPLITRKQRYAVVSCVMLVGTMIISILFQAECSHVPKSASCAPAKSFFEKAFSADLLFASIWGIICGVPCPLILIYLFKKQVVQQKQTGREKKCQLRFWKCKEKFAWLIVFSVHLFAIFSLSQFVRYYPWAMAEKWYSSTIWSLCHRFLTAPSLRGGLILTLLESTRCTWLCAPCLLACPKLAEFPLQKRNKAKAKNELSYQDGEGEEEGDDMVGADAERTLGVGRTMGLTATAGMDLG